MRGARSHSTAWMATRALQPRGALWRWVGLTAQPGITAQLVCGCVRVGGCVWVWVCGCVQCAPHLTASKRTHVHTQSHTHIAGAPTQQGGDSERTHSYTVTHDRTRSHMITHDHTRTQLLFTHTGALAQQGGEGEHRHQWWSSAPRSQPSGTSGGGGDGQGGSEKLGHRCVCVCVCVRARAHVCVFERGGREKAGAMRAKRL